MKKTKQKKIRNRKNVSQKVRNGTVILTRDEFFEDHNNYKKQKYNDKPDVFYREATVVDSNRKDELAVIKHQSGGKLSVKKKNNKVSKYNTYIKITDNEGKPIRIGEKFKRANLNYGVSEKNANQMKVNSVKNDNAKVAKDNRTALKKLKGRKK